MEQSRLTKQVAELKGTLTTHKTSLLEAQKLKESNTELLIRLEKELKHAKLEHD